MFTVTKIDTHAGIAVIEDIEMGLEFEFYMKKVMTAKVVADYDLELTDVYGAKKIIKILE